MATSGSDVHRRLRGWYPAGGGPPRWGIRQLRHRRRAGQPVVPEPEARPRASQASRRRSRSRTAPGGRGSGPVPARRPGRADRPVESPCRGVASSPRRSNRVGAVTTGVPEALAAEPSSPAAGPDHRRAANRYHGSGRGPGQSLRDRRARVHRLMHAAADLKAETILFYRPRRHEPGDQPLSWEVTHRTRARRFMNKRNLVPAPSS